MFKSASCLVFCHFVALCLSGFASESVVVRITDLDKSDDYLFVRGEVYGQTSNQASIVDTFVKTNLQAGWNWIDANRLGVGTNATAVLIVPQILECVNLPSQLFVKMSDRVSENGTMQDWDLDGSPNVYEIHNDTNPYVADFADAQRITVSNGCEYAAFTNALWSSTPYSIVEICGEMYFNDSIDLPDWPLLITGPTNGYAVIHSSADIGVFMVNRRQTDHTLIRNVYLTMDKKSSFQAGFWIGGNLPWSEESAGASFENVRIRMYNPGTWYYGWHMYGVTDTPVVISNCTISAKGATDVFPVYVYGDSQVVITNGLDLVNMPNETPSAEYSWSGYPLANSYESSRDSDGDGLDDYEEVVEYGTDPYLKDSDGDRIPDMDEILHGASPTNQEVYCFRLTVTITNAFENVDSVKLAFYQKDTGDRISEIAEVTNRIDSVELHCLVDELHCLVDDIEKPALRMWSSMEEIYVLVPYAIKGHNNTASVQSSQIRLLYDADNDGISDRWEVSHGLSPVNPTDAVLDPDNDGLINLHEYWMDSDPYVVDGTNTLLSVACKSIDRLVEANGLSISMFVNYPNENTPNVIERNPDFFAASVDFSAVSVWNSQLSTQRCVTAVSPYHVVGAAHWQVSAGYSVYFLGNDGVVYSNKIQSAKSFEYHYWNSPANTLDVSVGILESPLPSTVHPVKVLPTNVVDYVGTGVKLPVLSLSQDRFAYVREISSPIVPINPAVSTSITYSRGSTESRQAYYGTVRNGDSSCPNFLLCGATPVLLGCHLTASCAPSIILTQSHIQRLMNELSDQTRKPRYGLQYLDLTAFQRIGDSE